MDYSDIIHLPHPTPKRHPRMSMYQRAAQFAPFAALTGHEESVRDAAYKNRQKGQEEEDMRWKMDDEMMCRETYEDND